MDATPLDRHLAAGRRELDLIIDDATGRLVSAGQRLYCGPNCANCCTLAVNCTYVEAVRLGKTLNQEQQQKILERLPILERLSTQSNDLKHFLQSYRDQSGGCPLLNDAGNCSCYDERPLSCRALLSTRPAAWCAVDFSTLHPLEKQAFLSSLDPDLVAYPSHYLAGSLEPAARLEKELDDAFAQRYGVKISGNLVWLLGLELQSGLSLRLEQQEQGIIEWLLNQQELYPYLIQVTI